MTQNIRFSVDGDGIAILLIDVADRPMNVLTPGFRKDLAECVEKVAADPAIKGAVIGSAKSSFMAGADIKDMSGAFERGLTAAEAASFSGELNRLLRRLETCGKPFAAAVNGVALGGGFEVALACHYRVIEDSPKAGVGFPEVKIGLLPGAGGTQRTPRMIGVTEALRLISEGRQISAQDALKKGLVNEMAPAAEIVERARQWILKGGKGVQPWDVKGFRVPGGAGMSSPAAAQTFMIGTALAAKTTMRNYPAPAAILSAVYEGTAQPDAHHVHQQGAGGQARAPSRGSAEVAGPAARHPRCRHDGCGCRLRLGGCRHGRRAARQHARARRQGQGLLASAAREGRGPWQEVAGGGGRDPRAHQDHRRTSRARPRQ